MDVSKTIFKEYSKCDRIPSLEKLYRFRLNSDVCLFDDERKMAAKEMLSRMFDEETGDDLLEVSDVQLETMQSYYRDVEKWALKIAQKTFGLPFTFQEDTKKQTKFGFSEKGHQFYCYLDGYCEDETQAVIVEVKATTSGKFKDLRTKQTASDQERTLFSKRGNVLSLRADFGPGPLPENCQSAYKKMFSRYSEVGEYVFDLAVERYFIERSLRENHPELLGKKFRYYLAVLNNDYVLEKPGLGETSDYPKTEAGAELIDFIDLTQVTKDWLPDIDSLKEFVVGNLAEKTLPLAVCDAKCGLGTPEACLFQKVCWAEVFSKPSVLEYMGAKRFTDGNKRKHDKCALINDGMIGFESIPMDWIVNPNHRIQRECFATKTEYLNKTKMKMGMDKIVYPIYHLDFESFPCPLPRFRGEKPYSQSLFQFSIHIERKPGACDETRDHRSFLAGDFNDHREELIRALIETIDLSAGGTVMVYNQNFEYHQIKELARMFPEYQTELDQICDHIYDLLELVKTGKHLYGDLGLTEEEMKTVNYYHPLLRGKYSIKNVLPLFSDRSYANLEVKNGNEAIVAYARFARLPKEEIEALRTKLVAYCRQDTWSMVEILNKLIAKVQA